MIPHEDPDITALGYKAYKPIPRFDTHRVYYAKLLLKEEGAVAQTLIKEYPPLDLNNGNTIPVMYEVELYAHEGTHSASFKLYSYTKEELLASIENIEKFYLSILTQTLDITKE